MSLYLDTSMIVAAISLEPGTEAVLQRLEAGFNTPPSISDWVFTEVHSAMARKVRSGRMDLRQRAASLSQFSHLAASLELVAVAGRHFGTAALFCDAYETGLRAGDALHLALAADHGLTVCTLDRGLAGAGLALGVPTELIETVSGH